MRERYGKLTGRRSGQGYFFPTHCNRNIRAPGKLDMAMGLSVSDDIP